MLAPTSGKQKSVQRARSTTGNSEGALAVRLDAVLRLILDYQRKSKDTTIGDQILVLMDVGLSQADACRVLGVDPNQAPSYFRSVKDTALLKKLKKKEGNI